MQLRFQIAKRCIRESPQREVSLAARKSSDPRTTRSACPKRAAVIAVWITVVTVSTQYRPGLTVVTCRLWERLDGPAYAHVILLLLPQIPREDRKFPLACQRAVRPVTTGTWRLKYIATTARGLASFTGKAGMTPHSDACASRVYRVRALHAMPF